MQGSISSIRASSRKIPRGTGRQERAASSDEAFVQGRSERKLRSAGADRYPRIVSTQFRSYRVWFASVGGIKREREIGEDGWMEELEKGREFLSHGLVPTCQRVLRGDMVLRGVSE